MLHRALGQAARWDLVARNVVTLVDPPRVARHRITALTPEQARHFLDAARGDRLEALYVVALTTGMRQGELLALRWSDVDESSQALRVRGTLHHDPQGGWAIHEPKTAGSQRQVLLAVAAVDALRRHRTAQNDERQGVGPAWQDHDLVFANAVGGPLAPQNLLRRSFVPLLVRAGLPRVRFHDLRHTAATLLLAEGVHRKIVSELLGHSQVSITLDLYSHVTGTMQRAAVSALDGLLGSQLGSQEPR